MDSRPDLTIGPSTSGTKDVLLIESIALPPSNLDPLFTEYVACIINNPSPEVEIRSRKELLEEIILHYTTQTPPQVSDDATDEEKAADRTRCLNAPSTKWRRVFSSWPRDPNGNTITKENSKPGKAPDAKNQIWGATLFDFYLVQRIPGFAGYLAISSGSKLAAWMKENGEDFSKDLLALAEEEEDPRVIEPCSIMQLITRREGTTRGKSWVKSDSAEEGGKGKETKGGGWDVPQPWPPASPFDPAAYPSPWPRVPFLRETVMDIPTLQHYIPQRLLPKKLIVHDPWKLLCAESSHHTPVEDQANMRDIKRVYTRRDFTSGGAPKRREEDEKHENDRVRALKDERDKFLADPHSRNPLPEGMTVVPISQNVEPGPTKPPIYIAFPPLPAPAQPKEAHLYLSPTELIGKGNHSFVYRAEFELPRSLLVEDVMCPTCLLEDMHRILTEQDGPNGESRDPKWDEPSGAYVMKLKGKEDLYASTEWRDIKYLLRPGNARGELEYEGPYRAIETRVQYQNLERAPYCKHLHVHEDSIHPLTSTVKVAAKLSRRHDNHLNAEARNYQRFPKHFFEHYNGFNIINPMHDPTPVGALVPQFYGYYEPDKVQKSLKIKKTAEVEKADGVEKVEGPTGGGAEGGEPVEGKPMEGVEEPNHEGEDEEEDIKYLSPILLVEDCGRPITASELTVDDKNECCSLVLRFNGEGWVHNSVYQRNILVQPGPLSEFPLFRALNQYERGGLGVDWSFRLIDFGRSQYFEEEQSTEFHRSVSWEDQKITHWLWDVKPLDP